MSKKPTPVNVGMEAIGVGLRRLLKIYTPAELAVTLECSQSAVNLWRQEGTGPQWTRLGRRIYYRHEDVEAWINENVGRALGEGDDEEGSPMKSLESAREDVQATCSHEWTPDPAKPKQFVCAKCGAIGRAA